MNVEAVIFDLDGVIVHTDHYHFLAWKSIADELGIPFDEEINSRMRGVSRMESLKILLEPYEGPPLSEQDKTFLANKKNETYREMLKNLTPADVSDEVTSTLSRIKQMGIKIAIGSSSKNAKYILERIGLLATFDTVSDGTNITRTKPDPQVFLMAAEFVCTEPSRCLVIEDAVAGIEAAFAAGMRSVAVGDAGAHGCGDYQIRNFSELLELLFP